MNILYFLYTWLSAEMADFIETHGDYDVRLEAVSSDGQAFVLISAVRHDEMLVRCYDSDGRKRFTESEPAYASTVFEWWAERDVCTCAECRTMLKNGNDIVQNPVYKCGELSYIELAHRNCLPEWGINDNHVF